MNRLKSVDLLKGFAMIMVILVHYNQMFSNNIKAFAFGQMGCQIFFVLSGFVIANSFEKKLSQNNYLTASKDFYISRFLSIAPAYYAMMLIIFILQTLLSFVEYNLGFESNMNPIAILCNIIFIHGLVPFANNNVIPGGWYIGTTMLLYLITPIIVFFFRNCKYNKKLLFLIMSMFSILTLVITGLLIQKDKLMFSNNSFGYFSVLNQFPCFAIGILLFYESKVKVEKERPVLSFIFGSVFMIISIILFFTPSFKYSYIIDVQLVGISMYFILKSAISFEKHTLFQKILNSKVIYPIIKIGNISLYIYLVHTFFVRTFIIVLKKILSIVGINMDQYICYLIIAPMVIILSYYSANIFKWFIEKITKLFMKKV